ncbi:hypothetical protein SteCoe_1523 [Stentor coeruleus]|uniref:SET domain-containing protein n=1 Tax=Stentor coeruleus TaxID=5963 RepID=A0A1R2D1R5_9CILI|nr:hypothetical protein SteCoe_1523 [Stentor coeruleus]
MLALFLLTISQISESATEFSELSNMSLEELSVFLSPLAAENVKVMNYTSKGLGIMVEKNVLAGDIVFCVEKNIKILPNDAFPLSEYIKDLPDLVKLKVRIMYEKFGNKTKDFYTDYVNSWSTEYMHPGRWSKTQLEYFNKMNIINTFNKDLLEIGIYTKVLNRLSQVKNISPALLDYHNYLWASSHVRARFFSYPVESETIPVMIPYLDIANHYPNPIKYRNIESLVSKNGKDCLITYWDLKYGDEFVYEYKKLNALNLFVNYEIIYPNNPYDYFLYELKGKQNTMFSLSADSINIDLLNNFIGEYAEGLEVGNHYRKWFYQSKTKNVVVQPVIKGLIKYWNEYKIFTTLETPGLRQTRRNISKYQDTIMLKMTHYGISVRLSLYNHHKALDRELLFTLASHLFS